MRRTGARKMHQMGDKIRSPVPGSRQGGCSKWWNRGLPVHGCRSEVRDAANGGLASILRRMVSSGWRRGGGHVRARGLRLSKRHRSLPRSGGVASTAEDRCLVTSSRADMSSLLAGFRPRFLRRGRDLTVIDPVEPRAGRPVTVSAGADRPRGAVEPSLAQAVYVTSSTIASPEPGRVATRSPLVTGR
jgi:hypothetical protein